MNWFQKIKSSKSYTYIKSHRELIAWIVAVILFFLFLIVATKKKDVVVVDKNNKDLLAKVKEFKDKNDKLWSQVQTYVISEEEHKRRIDSLSKALGIKPKFIKGEDVYIYRSDTVFKRLPTKTVLLGKDTVYKVEKHDPWLDIVALAGKDSGMIEFSSRDTLTRVEIVKNPLIGRTTRTTMIRNTNPYSKMVEGYSYSIKEKDVFLSIGPMVGVSIQGKPIFGIGVQFPLIKFKR